MIGGHGAVGGHTPMQTRGGTGAQGGAGGEKQNVGVQGTGGTHGGHGGAGGQMQNCTTVGQHGGGGQQSGPAATDPVLRAVNKIQELMVRPLGKGLSNSLLKHLDSNAGR
jgi:hypothetical protein